MLRGYEAPTEPAPQPATEALRTQTNAANDDGGGASGGPRVVLPRHPEGLPAGSLGALQRQEVHEDDDSGHMWLQESVMDGDDTGGEDDAMTAARGASDVVQACLSAMALTAGAAVEGMGEDASEAPVAAQTGSPLTDGPGGTSIDQPLTTESPGG